MHGHAARGERQRDTAGPDAELERPTVAGEVREQLDDRIDRRRLEHLGGRFVVAGRHWLVEVAVGHAPECRRPPRYRAPMRRVLVTGMSGTGKSAALDELAKRGFRTVDTDLPGWSEWHEADGRAEWLW